jgi:RNA polymerase sigma-70 factor (ECF subfamily)
MEHTASVTDRERRAFATTRWSLVLAACGDVSSTGAHAALATLCEMYWYPLYAFLRRQSYGVEDAQDLTQAFFAQVLEKRAIERADPARGRFRSFLLASLKHFAANQHDRNVAKKRGGALIILSLDVEQAEDRLRMEPPSNETPERIFDRRWALTLLERVMLRLETELTDGNKRAQFNMLKAYLTGDQPQLSYAATAAQLGTSQGAVKVAVHRIRRRFRDLLRDEIAHTVASADEIDDEIRHLWSAVGR